MIELTAAASARSASRMVARTPAAWMARASAFASCPERWQWMATAQPSAASWAGEDPDREGLADTPARVTRAYAEWFDGYEQDPAEILQRTFKEVGGYDDIVVLRDIPFESCCEHHIDVQLSATSSTDTVALQRPRVS